MLKKIVKIFIVLLILALVLGGIWYFFILDDSGRDDVGQNTRNLFPFGEVSDSGQSSSGGQFTIGDDGEPIETDEIIDDGIDPDQNVPRLRKVSTFPTGGFVPLTKVEEQEILDIEIDEDGESVQVLKKIPVENDYIRYTAISDGTVYESAVTDFELTETKLVNNYVPNAEHVYFSPTGTYAAFQYWNSDDHTAETYLGELRPIELDIKPCPFEFRALEDGEDDIDVIGIHSFLNRSPQTRVSQEGTNSPGNEGSAVTEETRTAIKNFQSLYQLEIDGQIGDATKEQMLEVCDEQQRQAAIEVYNNLDEKYTLTGSFLSQDIASISMSPNLPEQMFYLVSNENGSQGTLRNLETDEPTIIFQSPFSEWLSQFTSENSIELVTKPSYGASGYSYELTPDTGRYFKKTDATVGLTLLVSPSGEYAIGSRSTGDGVETFIRDRINNTEHLLTLQTFADKCVWSKDGNEVYCGVPNSLAFEGEYPDSWYLGKELYNDGIWKISIPNFEETYEFNITDVYAPGIDIEKIMIDEDDDYLYFLDKETEHLWSLRLSSV